MYGKLKEVEMPYKKTLSFISNVDNIQKVKIAAEKVFDEFLRDTSRDFFEYLICVDEIFCNTIVHAYQGCEGRVDIIFTYTGKQLITEVKDYGKGIEDSVIHSYKEAKLSPTSNRGRGLIIVNNLANQLIIEKNPLGGTTVRFYFERGEE